MAAAIAGARGLNPRRPPPSRNSCAAIDAQQEWNAFPRMRITTTTASAMQKPRSHVFALSLLTVTMAKIAFTNFGESSPFVSHSRYRSRPSWKNTGHAHRIRSVDSRPDRCSGLREHRGGCAGTRGVSVVVASLGNDRAVAIPASSSASRSAVRCADPRSADCRRLHDRRREPSPFPYQDVAATNVEQANPGRNTAPHSRRHWRYPNSSASERSTSHAGWLGQYISGVQLVRTGPAVDRISSSRVIAPPARRTRYGEPRGEWLDSLVSSATAVLRNRPAP